jgi:hypothetical protein
VAPVERLLRPVASSPRIPRSVSCFCSVLHLPWTLPSAPTSLRLSSSFKATRISRPPRLSAITQLRCSIHRPDRISRRQRSAARATHGRHRSGVLSRRFRTTMGRTDRIICCCSRCDDGQARGFDAFGQTAIGRSRSTFTAQAHAQKDEFNRITRPAVEAAQLSFSHSHRSDPPAAPGRPMMTSCYGPAETPITSTRTLRRWLAQTVSIVKASAAKLNVRSTRSCCPRLSASMLRPTTILSSQRAHLSA